MLIKTLAEPERRYYLLQETLEAILENKKNN